MKKHHLREPNSGATYHRIAYAFDLAREEYFPAVDAPAYSLAGEVWQALHSAYCIGMITGTDFNGAWAFARACGGANNDTKGTDTNFRMLLQLLAIQARIAARGEQR